jgi:hypothetical protein
LEENDYDVVFENPQGGSIIVEKNNDIPYWQINNQEGEDLHGHGYSSLESALNDFDLHPLAIETPTKIETEIAVKHKSPTINSIAEEEGFKPTKELTKCY